MEATSKQTWERFDADLGTLFDADLGTLSTRLGRALLRGFMADSGLWTVVCLLHRHRFTTYSHPFNRKAC
jgi:hypothetical protein